MVEHSKNHTFNFVSTREAADFVSYTPDYISKLARDGKIVAKRSGRSWLVDKDSLKLFTLQQEAEVRRRQDQLREERRQEKILTAFKDRKKSVVSNDLTRHTALEAVAVTVCMMTMVLLTGVVYSEDFNAADIAAGLETASGDVQQAMLIESLPNWRDIFWLRRMEEVRSVEVVSKPKAENIILKKAQLASAPQISSAKDIVLLPPSVRETAEKVFSDEVHVLFTDSKTGTVTPIFLPGQFAEYQFVVTDNQKSN